MLTVRNLIEKELERRSGPRKHATDEPYLFTVHEYAPGKFEAVAMWRTGAAELDSTVPWMRVFATGCESSDLAERRVLGEILALGEG